MKGALSVFFVLSLVLEVSSSIPNGFTVSQYESFHSKLSSQHLEVKQMKHKGYGVLVTKSFNAGEPVLCVNISDRLLPSAPYEFSPAVSTFTNLTALKARLIYERFLGSPENPVSQYISSLSTYTHHYGLWTDKQKSLLRQVSLARPEDMEEEVLNEKEEWSQIVKAFKNFGSERVKPEMLDYYTFAWASFQVKSRYFWCSWESEIVDCMHPHLDLVNFEPIDFFSKNQEFLLDKDGKRCFLAKKRLEPGDELTFDYVIHRSFVFFLDYDIIQENYAFDSLDFQFKDKFFQLYAFSVNLDLLKEFSDNFEKNSEISEEKLKISALLQYRKTFLKHFNQIGIREVRRIEAEDEVSQKIRKYGISTRTTFYNHLARLEAELLTSFKRILNKG
jgi:hypothetical protein